MKMLLLFCVALAVLLIQQSVAVAPPSIEGNQVVGEDKKPVQLIGMGPERGQGGRRPHKEPEEHRVHPALRRSYKQDLRDKVKGVIADKEKGLPLFVTEYGTVEASGNGGANADESQKWGDFLDENKISYVNRAIEDKAEGAAALTPGTTSTQVGDESRLTESGKLVKAQIKKDTGVKKDNNNHYNK